MSDISLGLSRFTGFPGRCRLGPGKSALTVLSKVLSASYVETEVGQRLPTRECAISRSDGRQERGIAFPATSLLSFLVAQERKCPRGTGGRRKNKRPSATDITIKPTVICRESQPAETVNEHRERAGLRGARLRPARPKGRKTCPSHLIARFLLMRFFRIAGLCVQAALQLPGIGAKHFIYDEDRISGRSGASQKTSVKTIDHREIIGFRFIRPAFRFPDPVLILSVTSRIGSGTAATIRKKPASPFREAGPAKDVSGISARIRRRSRSPCRPR